MAQCGSAACVSASIWVSLNYSVVPSRFGRGIYSRDRYITHFYCLAIEAGFYSNVVECLPLDPAAQVRFSRRAVEIFGHPVTKWQSTTLFLAIFDPRSSIVKSVPRLPPIRCVTAYFSQIVIKSQ